MAIVSEVRTVGENIHNKRDNIKRGARRKGTFS